MLERLATYFSDAFLIRVPAFGDDRGYFKENYVRSKYHALGITDDFVQDNVSFSSRGVLRGLHADPQMAKLVYVLRGEAFDVFVDTRRDSTTFGKWAGVYLRAHEHTQLYIPAGFLHGFLALSDEVIFCYKQSAEYAPQREIGVRYDDRDLAIDWPLAQDPIVSPKDLANRSFRDALTSGSH
jgi:dTDP-4-dehydrorhamnose 3,5-epimerase